MNSNLTNYIRKYIDISDNEIELFQSNLKAKSIKKKEYILKEGKTCTARYFITKGYFRHFYIDNKANEQIIHFGIENWWTTDYVSLVDKTPSKMYIQALENAEYLELSQKSLERLYIKLPKIERFFRIIMEKTYIASQQRIEFMFSLSGKQLYEKFIFYNPEFSKRVPQYMLASYLGLSPEFISKIKSKQ